MSQGLPPLHLSSGPAVSDVSGNDGWSATGDFNFKREQGLAATFERVAPLLVIGVMAWMIVRR